MFGIILDRNRPRKVVFYGRVSTEHEAQLSALENQMQWYDDIARRFPNWEIVDKYIDEGITGTQAKKRPAFMKMIEDSKTGKFDLIVTREVCRFARNTVDTLTHTRELKSREIEVYFVDDNIWTMDGDGELRLTIMATLAQEESRKVSERVRAGQHISRSKNILYGCGNILGYDLKRNIGPDGKWDPSENTYVINPEQAETVKMIYDLYEEGNGITKIGKILTDRNRLNASGKVRWEPSTVLRILDNATYKGYICYNKSGSNNYLEQKRIVNRNKETYEYHKGDWEPIISEEQWERVQKLKNSKKRITTVHNGNVTGRSTTKSSCMWTNKLRCSCGSSFRRNIYHKSKDGKNTFCFICYNQIRFGKASTRAKTGIDVTGYCDIPCIAEWKMDMMSDYFIDQVWQDRKKDLLALSDEIAQYYREDSQKHTENNISFIEGQIERLQQKKKNLIDMFADGQINKDEYADVRQSYENEIDSLKNQRNSISEQQEHYSSCIEDLTKITKALGELIDVTDESIKKQCLNKFLVSIVPENDTYYWNYRLTESNEVSTDLSVSGNKRHPLILMGNNEEASDEDASDIHNKVIVSYFPSEHLSTNQNTTRKTMLHRLQSQIRGKFDSLELMCKFDITLEEAKAFRAANGQTIKSKIWEDINVEVRICG